MRGAHPALPRRPASRATLVLRRPASRATLVSLLLVGLAGGPLLLAGLAGGPLLVVSRASAAPVKEPTPFDPSTLTPYFTTGVARTAQQRLQAGDPKGAAHLFQTYLRRAGKVRHRHQAELLLAVALMRQSDWHRAAARFRRLRQSYPLLAPYHAYYAARCAVRGGRPAAALADLRATFDDTPLVDDAVLLRGEALAALGRWPEAQTAFEEYLQRFPAGAFATTARLRLAETRERLGRPAAERIALYRQVFVNTGSTTQATIAEARLKELAKSLPPAQAQAAVQLTAPEMVRRGRLLLKRQQHRDAEALLTAALTAPGLTSAVACNARYALARAVYFQRPRSRSAPLFTAALSPCLKARDVDHHVRALYFGGRAYVAKGEPDEALKLYAQLEHDHPGHSFADDARLRRAEILLDEGRQPEATTLLETLPLRYPTGDMRGDALWRLTWSAWQAGRLADVLRWSAESIRQVPRATVWYAEGRALYWNARALQRQGDPQRAAAGYARAITEYPLSYYALLSFHRLARLAPKRAERLRRQLTDTAKTPPWRFAARPLFTKGGFRRGVELMRLGLGSEARAELWRVGLRASPSRRAEPPATKEQEELGWLTAILYDQAGEWAHSHSIARYQLRAFARSYPRGLGRRQWEIAYPRAFDPIVTRSAKAAGIPAELLFAIAREESAFNPRALSHAHATGLTQLLLKTARRFAPKGVRVTRETLYEPAVNVRIGAAFLGWLWRLWKGNPGRVVASYNAGEGAVTRWVRVRGKWSLDEFIEAIPYTETRGYTKRVLASYFAYSWLAHTRIPPMPLR